VALGQQRHEHVVEHVVLDLDGAADVLLHATGGGGRGGDLVGPDRLGEWLERLH
jgi:hypothetical protein